jgi:hypothetical protein
MSPPTTSSIQAITAPDTWHRVPDPDDEPLRARILAWGKMSIGFELEGIYRGTIEGQFGPLGVVELADGRLQRFSLPAVLGKRLSIVDPGQEIRIVYMGTRVSKSDTTYHVFDVYSRAPIFLPAAESAGVLEAHAAGVDEDEVPF